MKNTISENINLLSVSTKGLMLEVLSEDLKFTSIIIVDCGPALIKLSNRMMDYLNSINYQEREFTSIVINDLAKVYVEIYIVEQLYTMVMSNNPYMHVTESLVIDAVDDLKSSYYLSKNLSETMYVGNDELLELTNNYPIYVNALSHAIRNVKHEEMGPILNLNKLITKFDFTMPYQWVSDSGLMRVLLIDNG